MRRLARWLRALAGRINAWADWRRFTMGRGLFERRPLEAGAILLAGDLASLLGTLGRGSLKLYRGSGGLTLAYFGNDYLKSESFLCSLFLEGPASCQDLGRMFLWQALRRVPQLLGEDALAAFEVSHLLPCGMAWADARMRCPAWVKWSLPIPSDLSSLREGMNHERKRHLSAVQHGPYSFAYTRERAEIEDFYATIHAPYILARHGDLALEASDPMREEVLLRGGMLKVLYEGRYVAACTGFVRGDSWFGIHLGVAQGEEALKDAVDAIYWGCLVWAQGQGLRTMDLGLTRAYARDGVFHVKQSWGGSIQREWHLPFYWALGFRRPSPRTLALVNHLGLLARRGRGLDMALFPPQGPEQEQERHSFLSALRRSGLDGILELEPQAGAGGGHGLHPAS